MTMTKTDDALTPSTTQPTAPVHPPATDMLEFEDRLELHLDLPGVTRDEVEVKFENGHLTIRAERKHDDEALTHREFGSARFRRVFTLPDGSDGEAISARHENGVLVITVPKAATVRPRRIEIS